MSVNANATGQSASEFDVVIIGSGPGGYVAAIRAGQLGLKTAVVEKDKKLGGTCLHRGCIPTKSLLHSAHLYEQVRNAGDFGIECGDVSVNFEKVQSKKDRIVKKLSIGIEYLLKKNKVQTVSGYGKIKSRGVVEVVGEDKKLTLRKSIHSNISYEFSHQIC